MIRWKKGDFITLGKAVSRFNKIVNELGVEKDVILPEVEDYNKLKESIKSRQQLKRVINSLKRATRENVRGIKVLDSGEKITQYEWKELNISKRVAIRNINRERVEILSTRPSIGMGEERLSELSSIEESFNNLSKKAGSDLKRVMERIKFVGASDYNLKKQIQFRENFYKALEGISNFQNYEILKNELDKITNPKKFYDYVNKSPILMDLFLWYGESDTLFYGAFNSNQEAFNSSLLFHLGIENISV